MLHCINCGFAIRECLCDWDRIEAEAFDREWAEAEDRANRSDWETENSDDPMMLLLIAIFGE